MWHRPTAAAAAADAGIGAAVPAAGAVLGGASHVAPPPAKAHAGPPRWLLYLLATAAFAAVTYVALARFDPKPLLAWVKGVVVRDVHGAGTLGGICVAALGAVASVCALFSERFDRINANLSATWRGVALLVARCSTT